MLLTSYKLYAKKADSDLTRIKKLPKKLEASNFKFVKKLEASTENCQNLEFLIKKTNTSPLQSKISSHQNKIHSSSFYLISGYSASLTDQMDIGNLDLTTTIYR